MNSNQPNQPDNLPDALLQIARLEAQVRALESILSATVEILANHDLPSEDQEDTHAITSL